MKEFVQLTERINALNMANALFEWDMSTGAPQGGAESRAKFIGLLGAEAFSLMISDEMKQYLDQLASTEHTLDDTTKALYRICKKAYDSNHKIPVDEMQAYMQLCGNAQVIWEKAKNSNSYSDFAPTLNDLIQYNIKFVDYRGFQGHPYNTLLDDYEPGITVEQLDVFFDKLKSAIVPLLKQITSSHKKIDTSFIYNPISIEKQNQISNLLMEVLGFDLNRGMIKESEHPFTQNFGKNDVRITTHYREMDFLSSFYSVIHELGHALYEQNKNPEIENTLLDTGISMGIHESQSRFYENMIGRSKEFWELIYDKLVSILGREYYQITPLQFYEASNCVSPTLIRIDSDELTYALHIMIRYEIEKDLLANSYQIETLPQIWNQKYQEYLGLSSDTDARGILQDVHWSGGSFGYFPSYALGNAYAAQLYSYMNREFDVSQMIQSNKIASITDWLKQHIHQYGSLKTPQELITSIHGEALNADYLVEYLTKKYSSLYEL